MPIDGLFHGLLEHLPLLVDHLMLGHIRGLRGGLRCDVHNRAAGGGPVSWSPSAVESPPGRRRCLVVAVEGRWLHVRAEFRARVCVDVGRFFLRRGLQGEAEDAEGCDEKTHF